MIKLYFILLTFILTNITFATDVFKDYMQQAPSFSSPKRGTLKGEFSTYGDKSLNLSTGSYQISLPLSFPDKRGTLGYPLSISYSPGFGASEFGIGWSLNLTIKRFRDIGKLNYLDDHLSSPWGELVQGTDGYYYSIDPNKKIRAIINLREINVFLPNGSIMTFGDSNNDSFFNENSDGNVETWFPNEVITKDGVKTKYIYVREDTNEWPILKEIQYGGLGDDFQYKIDFEYDEKRNSLEDYSLGRKLIKNKMVERLIVLSKVNSNFQEMHRYEFEYYEDLNSPAMYLVSSQKVIGSSSYPKQLYQYDIPGEFLNNTQWEYNSGLSELSNQYHSLITNPSYTNLVDFNRDGRIDLEVGQEYKRFERTDQGLEEIVEEAPVGPVSSWCLFPVVSGRKGRRYLNFLGNDSEKFVYSSFKYGNETILDICKPNGERVDYFRFPRFWEEGPKTIFADINNDFKPDLVQVGNKSLSYIANTSDGTTISFAGNIEKISLNLPTHFFSVWIRDINGDGQSDLVLKGTYSLYVHFGTSSGGFNEDFTQIKLYLDNWIPSSFRLDTVNLQFIDMNKDSLSDIVVSTGGEARLFLNSGSYFKHTYVPGMFVGDNFSQNLISGDLTGNGSRELATTIGNDIYILPLDRNGLGLLKSVDDGQGSILEYEYIYSNAQIGIETRKMVLNKLSRESYGDGSFEWSISYKNIAKHSIHKNFLGFENINLIQNTFKITDQNYTYDFNNNSLVNSINSYDLRTPHLSSVINKSYEIYNLGGIDFNLIDTSEEGYYDSNTDSYSLLSSNFGYENSKLCQNLITKSDSQKTLTITKTFDSLINFSDHLSCLDETVGIANGSFNYLIEFERDQFGRVVQVKKGGYLQQELTYGFNERLATLWEAGKGLSTFNYTNFRLDQIVEPSGVIKEISAFNETFEEPLSISEVRNSSSFIQNFDYDDLGRLSKEWHNLGNFSASNPQSTYLYQFPTTSQYGVIEELLSIELSPITFGDILNYFWTTSGGQQVGAANKGSSNFIIQDLTKYLGNENITKKYRTQTLDITTNPFLMNNDSFDFSINQISQIEKDYLGLDKYMGNLSYNTLENTYNTNFSVESGNFVQSNKENNNNNYIKEIIKDAFGNITSKIDELGNEHIFSYDSLGRITEIDFPEGGEHTVLYHSTSGLVESIEKTGIGHLEYSHNLNTNLVSEKRRYGVNGLIDLKSVFSYDSIGRVTLRVDERYDNLGNLIDTNQFEYLYDGQYFNQSQDNTQLGFLTAIRGGKYVKEFSYAPDGLMTNYSLNIDNKKKITKSSSYYAQRDLEENVYVFEDLTNSQILLTRNIGFEYKDFHGQVAGLNIDSVPFLTMNYNNLNELSDITYNSNFLTFLYDGNTRKHIGYSENGFERGWTFSDRNLIDSVSYTVGSRQIDNNYLYTSNKYLESLATVDTGGTNYNLAYEYNNDGLMDVFNNNGTIINMVVNASNWQIGSETYQVDSVGRVTSKSGKDYTYGASGRIESVKENSILLADYYYDEEGNPIVKEYANGDVEFYFEESVFRNADYFFPLKVPGTNHNVGYFKNGTFNKVGLDHLGSVIVENTGGVNHLYPYGERLSRSTEDFDLFDFTQKGYDKEIGAVRMGKRYYDPVAKRFLTPDSFFIENFEKVAESPVEGNLYSYGGNNPILFTDPTGQCLGSACLQVVINEMFVRKEPQKVMNSVKDSGKVIVKTAAVVGEFTPINNAVRFTFGKEPLNNFSSIDKNARKDAAINFTIDIVGGKPLTLLRKVSSSRKAVDIAGMVRLSEKHIVGGTQKGIQLNQNRKNVESVGQSLKSHFPIINDENSK